MLDPKLAKTYRRKNVHNTPSFGMDDGLRALMGIDDNPQQSTWEEQDEAFGRVEEEKLENEAARFRPAPATFELENTQPDDDMQLDRTTSGEEDDVGIADSKKTQMQRAPPNIDSEGETTHGEAESRLISLVADLSDTQSEADDSPQLTADSPKTSTVAGLYVSPKPARTPSPKMGDTDASSISSSSLLPDRRKLVGRLKRRGDMTRNRVPEDTAKPPNDNHSPLGMVNAIGDDPTDSCFDGVSQEKSVRTDTKPHSRRRGGISPSIASAEAQRVERLQKMFDSLRQDDDDDSDQEEGMMKRARIIKNPRAEIQSAAGVLGPNREALEGATTDDYVESEKRKGGSKRSSDKAMIEMYQENARLIRSTTLAVEPRVVNKKVMASFLEKIRPGGLQASSTNGNLVTSQNDSELSMASIESTASATDGDNQPENSTMSLPDGDVNVDAIQAALHYRNPAKASPPSKAKNLKTVTFTDDSDSDLEIVGGPGHQASIQPEAKSPGAKKITAYQQTHKDKFTPTARKLRMLVGRGASKRTSSLSQQHNPHVILSDGKDTTLVSGAHEPKLMTPRDLNAVLQQKIAVDLLKRRKKAEEDAKARGMWKSAEELMKKQVDKEKELEKIKAEVDRRLKGTGSDKKDDDENDEDFVPGGDDQGEEEIDYEALELGSGSDGSEDDQNEDEVGSQEQSSGDDEAGGDEVDSRQHVFSDSEVEEEREIDGVGQYDEQAESDDGRPAVMKKHRQPLADNKMNRSRHVMDDDDEDLNSRVDVKPMTALSVSQKLNTQVDCKSTQGMNQGTPGLSAYFKPSNVVGYTEGPGSGSIIRTQGARCLTQNIGKGSLGLSAYFKPSNVVGSPAEHGNDVIPGASAFFAPSIMNNLPQNSEAWDKLRQPIVGSQDIDTSSSVYDTQYVQSNDAPILDNGPQERNQGSGNDDGFATSSGADMVLRYSFRSEETLSQYVNEDGLLTQHRPSVSSFSQYQSFSTQGSAVISSRKRSINETGENDVDGILEDDLLSVPPRKLGRLFRRTDAQEIGRDIEDEINEVDEVDEEGEADSEGSEAEIEAGREQSSSPIAAEQPWWLLSDRKAENSIVKPSVVRPKSNFVEDEAEEEEDEFMGLGGADGEDEDGPDEYEIDGDVVVRNEETDRADQETVRQAFQKQVYERDAQLVDQLVKDVTSGGFMRRRGYGGADGKGFGLDDDYYFDDGDDMMEMRRLEAARRKRMLLAKGGGDLLDKIAENPETAAFAKASKADIDEDECILLSDGGDDAEEEPSMTDANDTNKVQSSETVHPDNLHCDRLDVLSRDSSATNDTCITDGEVAPTVTTESIAFLGMTSRVNMKGRSLLNSPSRLQRFKNAVQEGAGGGEVKGNRSMGFGVKRCAVIEKSPTISRVGEEALNFISPRQPEGKGSRLLGVLGKKRDCT
ncbi:MRC1-like domain-containing protein [Jimgerdemannia flammicorona]|uniref:MRC1-like domain-containing protein n=1 Tax=Jimgerdemannia flammicorona TaxID=994334 RepID=A0A433DA53_9FUNG|nr:MRC1-like domain-containing protein [Jimgerdemannia flammicorona]